VSIDLAGAGMVGLTRDTFATLHARLFQDPGGQAAAYLQEAGYAGGHALHQAFAGWCASKGLSVPEEMGGPEFGQRAAEFFSQLGWGSLTSGMLHDSVMTLDSADWAEANPASGMQYPGCYLSAGLLADFFGRIANAQLAALEVECRSMGHERCRFIVGSAETIQHVYDGFAQGVDYDSSLAQMA
jgi:predicted hydrocarbon binding protein